jgi:hypothetical protein
MKDYSNSPKREAIRQKGTRVGSLTLNRKFWAPKINGSKKRKGL